MPKRMAKLRLGELQKMWQKKNMAQKAEKLWEDRSGFTAIQSTKTKKAYTDLTRTSNIISCWMETYAQLLLHLQSLCFVNGISQDFVWLSEQINPLKQQSW